MGGFHDRTKLHMVARAVTQQVNLHHSWNYLNLTLQAGDVAETGIESVRPW